MCFGSKTPRAKEPAPPPPPPPVLEQTAPETAATTPSEAARRSSSGTKKYRTSLGITAPNNSAVNTSRDTGLGIG
jgi:hypothetical protein